METTSALTKSLAGSSDKLKDLDDAKHFHGFDDLAAARKAFLRFSSAAAAVVEPYRKLKSSPEFHLWECPMVDQAIPGALKKGRWIQLGDRPGHNPYFGADMLDCGKEIQP
jgi:Cu(I)/Ag(I) efflux system membrane fusion protein